MAFSLCGGKVLPQGGVLPRQEVIVVTPGVVVYSKWQKKEAIFISEAYTMTWGPSGLIEERTREVYLPNPLCPGGDTIIVPVGSIMLSPEQLTALNAAREQGWRKETPIQQEGVLNPTLS